MGEADTTGQRTESASLPKLSSIFTAKAHAIHLAPNTISLSKGKNFSIFTNLRSYIQALQKQTTTYPKAPKLKHTIANLEKLGKTVEICWQPRHAGIPETDELENGSHLSER